MDLRVIYTPRAITYSETPNLANLSKVGEKDIPDVKSKKEENDDDKHIKKDKSGIKSNKEHKQDIKMIKTKPDMNEMLKKSQL